jgi:hypothetical protein
MPSRGALGVAEQPYAASEQRPKGDAGGRS